MSSDRQMPPWEEIQWFLSPKTTVTPVSSSTMGWTQVCQANPNRVVLWLAAIGPVQFSPDSTIPLQGGLPFQLGQPPLIFREKDDANMCTSAWYATAANATQVTAIEVILRTWPTAGVG